MRRRTKWLIVCALTLSGIVTVIFMLAPRQPSYQGRNLNEWVADLSSTHYDTQRVARAAIRAMGPAAVPFLTNSLAQRNAFSIRAYRNNFAVRKIASWARGMMKLQTPMTESHNAAIALQTLGPQATNAIPELVAALHDSSWTIGQAAAVALGSMGTNAVPAVGERLTKASSTEMGLALQAITMWGTNAAPLAPTLAKMIATNAPTSGYAASALARIGREAVPWITNALSTVDDNARLQFLRALAEIGEPAIAATNQLAELIRSTNAMVRLHARYALGATYLSKEFANPIWLEGLHDSDSTNVAVSLHFLTLYPANVRRYNREIAALTNHPTNSIALAASNALAKWGAWPQ
jgi:HEAT repeat protein